MMSSDLKPLFKWAGGKRNSLPEIAPYLQKTSVYVEPFFGGGAVFCYMANMKRAKRYIINDIRKELIEIYLSIRDGAQDFVAEGLELNKAYAGRSVGQLESLYYDVRDEWSKSSSPVKLLFLLNTNFGGVYQVDAITKSYNTSSGHSASGAMKKIPIQIDQIWLWHHALQNADIFLGDFAETPVPNDDAIIFCDPPYYETGVDYESSFTAKDQIRCFNWCDRLANDERASVIFTNNDANNFFSNLGGGKKVEIHHYPISYSAGRANSTQEEMLMVWNPKRSHLLASDR